MLKRTDEEIIELFKSAKTRKDIANLLEIEDRSLRYFLFVLKPDNMYTSFDIPKKHGGKRTICAPNKKLKNIQKKLSYVLDLIYTPKICAYGFIKNKNILDNAIQHVKRSEILNIDLKDFFAQFHFGRVEGMLKSPPYSLGEEAARTIAQIACYNGALPQGAPTSPILTNMLCVPLDNQIMQYSKKHGLKYTRYADDLTFSSYGNNISQSVVHKVNKKLTLDNSLQKVLSRNNLVVNEEKIALRTKSCRQEVTGIVVNKFPNIKREYSKTLRALLHNCTKNGVYEEALKYIEKGNCKNKNILSIKDNPESRSTIEEWFKQVIIGKIRFILQIKGERSFTFYSLASVANDIFKSEIFDLSYFDQINNIIDKNVFVVQNKDGTSQGTGFFVPGYGLFTSYHVTQDKDFYNVLRKGRKLPSIVVSESIKYKSADKTIDYILFDENIKSAAPLTIGKSSNLKIGDTVIIAGYPDYIKGDSITKEECQFTGETTLFDAPLYKVSGRIVHGASGGLVLNSNYEVVGIIKGGTPPSDDDNSSFKQGFIPIDLIVDDLKSKGLL